MNSIHDQLADQARSSARLTKTHGALFSTFAENCESAGNRFAALADKIATAPAGIDLNPLADEFLAISRQQTEAAMGLSRILAALHGKPDPDPDLDSTL